MPVRSSLTAVSLMSLLALPLATAEPLPGEDPTSPAPTPSISITADPTDTPTHPVPEPTGDPTPEPTAEPEPTESPDPAPTESPTDPNPVEPSPVEPSPAPTSEPEPEPTSEPEPEPTSEPEPEPTSEPEPEPTAEPTEEPEPEPSAPAPPAPTSEPDPSETEDPRADSLPLPAPPADNDQTPVPNPTPGLGELTELAPEAPTAPLTQSTALGRATERELAGVTPPLLPTSPGAESAPAGEEPSPASVLGLFNLEHAERQTYNGTPGWVEGFLNAGSGSGSAPTTDSSVAAGVMGAESRNGSVNAVTGGNVFERGIAIMSGSRPLLIFTGIAGVGLLAIVGNFMRLSRANKR